MSANNNGWLKPTSRLKRSFDEAQKVAIATVSASRPAARPRFSLKLPFQGLPLASFAEASREEEERRLMQRAEFDTVSAIQWKRLALSSRIKPSAVSMKPSTEQPSVKELEEIQRRLDEQVRRF